MTAVATAPRRPGMAALLRPTLTITLLTVIGQAVGFLTQVVIAASFGARADMDAFLAASTLPQYVISVLVSALGFVFIPVFVEYSASGREDEAWDVASGVLMTCATVLGVLTLGGVAFARPLLRLTTPGLTSASLDIAVRVAWVTWPTIVLTGLASLLTGIYHARSRFGWPAGVPVLGAIVNLGLVAWLARPWGVIGVAVAATASLALQVALLVPIAARGRRFRAHVDWAHPGVQRVFHLLVPLVLAGLFTRWTPIIDRYLASGIAEGAISHLGYAFRLVTLLVGLMSTGIATTAFPRMALNSSEGDLAGLRETMSTALRLMWMAVAPAMAIGAVIALPLVATLFERGAFRHADTGAVAMLLRIYLLSLVASSLSGVTARAFYALKDTRTPAIVGVFEALAYALYTPLLARWLGAPGIAFAYAVYFDVSLLWQVLVIRHRTGSTGGRKVIGSFARTGLAALSGAAVAWAMMLVVNRPAGQLAAAGGLGVVAYLMVLSMTGTFDVRSVRHAWLRGASRPAS